MPTYRQVDEHGNPRTVRAPFNRESYSVPVGWVDKLRASFGGEDVNALLADREGPFNNMTSHGERERAGKRFVLLRQHGMPEWAIEVELTGGALGEVRELPPEETWELVRANDQRANPPIEVAPIDPKRMF
ncbi:MAG: hypothetical protein KIT72_08540 [Polyangiaceae bacterium]|nr:hypothetical protein [Polyangiaceae bacterium]MCW5790455.1 hypothetical protein [Polyangiaceae bacterium]